MASVTASPFRFFAWPEHRFILSILYIPSPAKLLFTIDDGWNNYLGKHGGSVSQWTRICVEHMLACGTLRYGCSPPLLRLA